MLPASWRRIVVLSALWLASCATHPAHSLHPSQQAQSKDVALIGCAGLGAFSCRALPFEELSTQACAHLRTCLEGRRSGDQVIRRVVGCSEPGPVVPAPQPGVAVAAVAAEIDLDSPPFHGAYLFVRYEQGWCLVDQLLEPVWAHGGYCEADFRLQWERGDSDSAVALNTLSGRTCYMPLDQEEIAAGESDIAMSECRRARYELGKSGLTALSHSNTDGPCSSQ